jgi:multisubunit Na+/H+ antiporter MnhE subunit
MVVEALDMTKLQISDIHRMLTLDIKDLYVHIPIDETLNITKTILDTHNGPHITTQIVHLLTAVLEQNDFSYQNVIYKPCNGVAMSSPTSGIVAKIFSQHLKECHIAHFLDTHHIICYTRYVDYIIIVYDSNLTNPSTITHHANSLHHNIKLTPTMETNYTLSFLDLNITRTPTGISIDIYRKPTTTDTLTNHQRKQEWAHITLMAHNNNFPIYLLKKLKHTAQNKQEKPLTPHKKENKKKWASFTYSTPLI